MIAAAGGEATGAAAAVAAEMGAAAEKYAPVVRIVEQPAVAGALEAAGADVHPILVGPAGIDTGGDAH